VTLKDRAHRLLPPVIVGVFVLVFWEAACRMLKIPSYLFPTPSVVADALWTGAPSLLYSLWMTVQVTLIALALSVVIGALIAFLFVQSPIIERSLFPYAIILQVTPIVAVAPLIIILRSSPTPRSGCAASMSATAICSRSTRRRGCKTCCICGSPPRCRSSSPA
jgi:NitT/TauT family transport system permease protein